LKARQTMTGEYKPTVRVPPTTLRLMILLQRQSYCTHNISDANPKTPLLQPQHQCML
jgi:hypothetical protein